MVSALGVIKTILGAAILTVSRHSILISGFSVLCYGSRSMHVLGVVLTVSR